MFLDELAKLMEIEYVTDNNLDKLYDIYINNLEYMQNKGLESGKELQDLFKIEGARPKSSFWLRLVKNYCGLLDCYLDYPKIGDVI